MKKYIYLILSLLLIPIMVNAETLTYEVCDNGCEYSNLRDVKIAIENISDLTDKDIVINVNSDMDDDLRIGDIDNMANSVTINGNNHDLNNKSFILNSKKVEINDSKLFGVQIVNTEKISINNSIIKRIEYSSIDSNDQIKPNEVNISNAFNIDEISQNNLKWVLLYGNIKLENMDFSNQVLIIESGNINIFDSKIWKIYNLTAATKKTAHIYNSKFKSLKYTNITSEEDDARNEYIQFFSYFDSSLLHHDIYDIQAPEYSNTTVYFDKETNLKPSDKLNLPVFLDYYTEDKEIEYTIEDESIAKIENKELIGLKEGSTKVTVTTDDGHVVYIINLVVEKETIPEKIDKMTIKVPITGNKVKIWVVVVSALLLAVIGGCIYMLIKNKKVTK